MGSICRHLLSSHLLAWTLLCHDGGDIVELFSSPNREVQLRDDYTWLVLFKHVNTVFLISDTQI